MKVYELIQELLKIPAGAEVRAMNGEDAEALAMEVEGVDFIAPDNDRQVPVAGLFCTPFPPQGPKDE